MVKYVMEFSEVSLCILDVSISELIENKQKSKINNSVNVYYNL